MVAIFTLIWALQLFTEPMLLNQSSPMVSSRFSPSMYIYDAAFTRNNYSPAAAASVVLLVCTIALSYGVTRFTSRADSEGGPMSATDSSLLRPRLLGRATVNVVVAISVLYTLLPVLRLVLASTKTRDALFSSDLLSLSDFSFGQNLTDLFAMDGGLYGRWYVNSLLYAVVGCRRRRAGERGLRLRLRLSTASGTRRSCSAWCWRRSWCRRRSSCRCPLY